MFSLRSHYREFSRLLQPMIASIEMAEAFMQISSYKVFANTQIHVEYELNGKMSWLLDSDSMIHQLAVSTIHQLAQSIVDGNTDGQIGNGDGGATFQPNQARFTGAHCRQAAHLSEAIR